MEQENKESWKKFLKSFEVAKRTNTYDFISTFLDVWHKGGDIKTVAEELGITPGAVRSRIKSLRSNGVDIPEFPKKV